MINQYVKSPLNFQGGKFKLLPQIVPLFPEDMNVFLDLFAGGFNVGINVDAERIYYNDSCKQVMDIISMFYFMDSHSIDSVIENNINKYGLNKKSTGYKDNKESYLKLRDDYNKNPNPYDLYTLIICAFSNQVRFNKNGEFNMPFGERGYNDKLRENLIRFVNKIHTKNVKFSNRDFRDMNLDTWECFVYADPPYLNSVATYNENGGWTSQDEQNLYDVLDQHDKVGKFALSNNLKYDNPILKEWMKKYNVNYLNMDYVNCNYQKKQRNGDKEILITNY